MRVDLPRHWCRVSASYFTNLALNTNVLPRWRCLVMCRGLWWRVACALRQADVGFSRHLLSPQHHPHWSHPLLSASSLCLCFPTQNATIRESRDLSTPTLSSVSLVNFFFLFFEDAATENHSALTPLMVFKILEKVVAEVFLLDVAADV